MGVIAATASEDIPTFETNQDVIIGGSGQNITTCCANYFDGCVVDAGDSNGDR